MDSVRIEVSSGWWEIKGELTRADKRHIDRQVESSAFETMSRIEERGLSMDKLQGLSSPDVSGPRKWGSEEEEAYLLRCSTAWSWDEPITAESIGDRSNKDVDRVLTRMRELYLEDDDKEGKSPSGESLNSLNLVSPVLDGTGTLSRPSV